MCTPTDSHLRFFANVQDTLLVTDAFDVGLMKNAAPLVVVPKSDCRPYGARYPTCKESYAY